MEPSHLHELDKLIAEVVAADLSEAEVETAGLRVHIQRNRTGRIAASTTSLPSEEQSLSRPPAEILAPLVGYFRAPEAAIKVGDQLSEGDLVGSIVSLGLANEVRSPVAGAVVEVLVQEGQPVEYGQPLYRLETGGEAK